MIHFKSFQILAKQKECRRNEIPVEINGTHLCYVHLVNTFMVILISKQV